MSDQQSHLQRVLRQALHQLDADLSDAQQDEQRAVELLQRATAARVHAQESADALRRHLAMLEPAPAPVVDDGFEMDDVPATAEAAGGGVRVWRAGSLDIIDQDTL